MTATGVLLAQTVFILNLGGAIESVGASGQFSAFYNGVNAKDTMLQTNTELATSSGAVMFTNNACQLESGIGMNQRAFSNVLILSLDYLNFADNHCWVDGPELSAFFDAMLLAGSAQVNCNRFQESPALAVLASGVTVGALNVTSSNISTYCLFVEGIETANANNLSIIPARYCTGTPRR